MINTPTDVKKIICPDLKSLSVRAADAFVDAASRAIEEKGLFSVALSGGSTPKALYSLLAADEYKKRIDWKRTHIFWGDERCLAPDHPESNYGMTYETLLSKIDIPGNNIHRIKGESGSDAACDYEDELKTFFRASGVMPPRFDLILLGMGEDGHTASIFPHTPAVTEMENYLTALYMEKLKNTRITLTCPVINAASALFILVSGEGKAKTLKAVLEGPFDPQKYPVQLTRRAAGEVTWFIDESAASLLETSRDQDHPMIKL